MRRTACRSRRGRRCEAPPILRGLHAQKAAPCAAPLRPRRARALAACVLLAGCAAPLERFEFERPAMGTRFRIVLFADSPGRARRAAEDAFRRVALLEARLSDWRAGSEVARALALACASPGHAVPVSPDLARVGARAVELARRTGGAFDPTVGPLVRLWRRAQRQGEPPAAEALAAARAASGHEHLSVDPAAGTLSCAVPAMALDFGAIAKGDALDQALARLVAHGLPRALVAGGGDLVAGAPPPGEAGWRIELAELTGTGDGDGDGEPAPLGDAGRLELAHAALAASGDLYRYADFDGERVSHVLDPESGQALRRRVLATVLARDGATADALATACCVAGPEQAGPLLAREPGAAARLQWLEDGRLRACTFGAWPPMMPAAPRPPVAPPPAAGRAARPARGAANDPARDPPP